MQNHLGQEFIAPVLSYKHIVGENLTDITLIAEINKIAIRLEKTRYQAINGSSNLPKSIIHCQESIFVLQDCLKNSM